MNDWQNERERAAGEAEQRIGLHRDGLVDTLARLKEALRAVDKRAIDESYGIQADRLSAIAAITHAALKAAENEAGR